MKKKYLDKSDIYRINLMLCEKTGIRSNGSPIYKTLTDIYKEFGYTELQAFRLALHNLGYSRGPFVYEGFEGKE